MSATPPDDAWLDAELHRLLWFGSRVVHPLGGAAWLDEDGVPDLSRPVHTWITSRTVHVFGVGAMRWRLRVEAYLLLLVDEYPPFSLE